VCLSYTEHCDVSPSLCANKNKKKHKKGIGEPERSRVLAEAKRGVTVYMLLQLSVESGG
jgi:hypothetical protein